MPRPAWPIPIRPRRQSPPSGVEPGGHARRPVIWPTPMAVILCATCGRTLTRDARWGTAPASAGKSWRQNGPTAGPRPKCVSCRTRLSPGTEGCGAGAGVTGFAKLAAFRSASGPLPSPSGEGPGVGACLGHHFAMSLRWTRPIAPTPTPPLKGRGFVRGRPLQQYRQMCLRGLARRVRHSAKHPCASVAENGRYETTGSLLLRPDRP